MRYKKVIIFPVNDTAEYGLSCTYVKNIGCNIREILGYSVKPVVL